MTLAASLRAWRYASAIEQRSRDYSQVLDEPDRWALQLELWNEEWGRILAEVPYYQDLAKTKRLPKKFSSWEQFFDSLPVVYRNDVQQHGQAMASSKCKPDFYRTTGGSTAEPLKIPGWHSEKNHLWPNFCWALTWYGVDMCSHQFLVWGRSHTLGFGLKGFLQHQKRRLKDLLLGIYRCSAYDLGSKAMRQAALALIKVKPDYIYGYSVALDQLARINLELRSTLRELGIKVVIGTAESFPSSDSPKLLEDLFNCPAAMEYGSVETGAMAFISPQDNNYKIFWRQYFLEAEKIAGSSNWRVRVTSLYPRCFPLIRYDLGDEIELLNGRLDFYYGLNGFKKVIGRCNAYIELVDGTNIHSEAFTHAIKVISNILCYQVVQKGKESFEIYYIAANSIKDEQIAQIHQRLKKIHPLLAEIPIVRVDKLDRTVAGKTPMVIKKLN
jgi:phenylacetate-CoA ligase